MQSTVNYAGAISFPRPNPPRRTTHRPESHAAPLEAARCRPDALP
ncbi:hypothetical protein HMPREF3227_00765 [Corynebacterium sp. CMW7794]|nr:hypothetical protein HMPREF3227_00765 [Corynebacterium sp. CMW7794]